MRSMNVPAPAIVENSVDLAKLRNQWEMACGREERTEKSLAEVRLEKGRILVEARKAFPAKGPKSSGWGDLLRKWNIELVTAWNYMKLAGYVDKVSSNNEDTSRPIPTYTEAGITKPKANSKQDDDDAETAIEVRAPASSQEWLDELERLAEVVRRHGKALFSAAQHLDALCRTHEATVMSPTILTLRSMLAGAKASISDALKLIGGNQ